MTFRSPIIVACWMAAGCSGSVSAVDPGASSSAPGGQAMVGAASATAQAMTVDAEIVKLLGLLNNYRAANGLGALTPSVTLTNDAAWMANDMAAKNYFSHTDSLGRDPFQRMAAFGYNFNTWKGENLAAGTADAQAAFDLWRNSPGHNANMLGANFTAIGLGRAYGANSSYGWYWAQEFGGYVDAPANYVAPNQQPVGFHDVSDCTQTAGWTYDPDTSAAIAVHVYVDGPAGSGAPGYAITANLWRADLGRNVGFSWPTPASLKDGKTHTIYTYAIDSAGGPNPLLGNSPKTFTCAPPNHPPGGWHKGADCTHTWGWAVDQDVSYTRVAIYRDGPAGTGRLTALLTANKLNPEIGLNNAFDWTIPDSLKDNKSHALYAYAVDNVGGFVLLFASPKSIQCVPPDSDGDGFNNNLERALGTDPYDACADSSTDNAWPADFNNDRVVNNVDVNTFIGKLNLCRGQTGYSSRHDLNGDGCVTLTDVTSLSPYYGKTCTN